TSLLEMLVLAKPYFDPTGLIVAVEAKEVVGFAHAGFGPNEDGSAADKGSGAVCLLGVLPSHRRRGIGSALLERAESYLKQQGSKTILAGAIRPLTPFYLGLYGGSEVPGFLSGDRNAGPFFLRRGYEPCETSLILDRRLDRPFTVADGRF